MDDKIMKRMRALLAMANDASNENESEIAMKRLHSLLAKHNMSMVDIKDSDSSDPIGESSFVSYLRPWHSMILYGISKLYFCGFYLNGGRKKKIIFVGTEINRLFALGMAQSLIFSINSQATIESNKYDSLRGRQWSSFNTSFLNGASATVYHRCMRLIEDSKRGDAVDDEGKNLPVLASVYDQHKERTDSYMDTLDLCEGRNRKGKSTNASGFNAGESHGKKVQLTRSVQRKNAQLALS